MALATYSDLKSELGTWLARSGLDGRISNAVAMFEAEYNASDDNYFAEGVETLTTTAGDPLVDLPGDFRELVSMSNATGSDVPLVSLPVLNSQGSQYQGYPRMAALYPGKRLKIGPVPDAVHSLELIYQANLSGLSDTAPSNWMLQEYPFLYVYGALKFLLDQLQDGGRAADIKAEYARLLTLVQSRKAIKSLGRTPVMRASGAKP